MTHTFIYNIWRQSMFFDNKDNEISSMGWCGFMWVWLVMFSLTSTSSNCFPYRLP